MDSPLRRAREYAQTIAGSPSPIRRIVTKGTFQFEISPEKTQLEGRFDTSMPTTFGETLKKNAALKVSKIEPKDIMVTPEKKVSNLAAQQRSATKSSLMNRIMASTKKTNAAAKHVKNMTQQKSTVKMI